MIGTDRLERIALYVPALYTYITRTRSIKTTFLIYFLYTAALPISFIELTYLMKSSLENYITEVLPDHLAVYAFSYLLFFMVYETGYIYNDVISERKEGKSTGRLRSSFIMRDVLLSTLFRLAIWSLAVLIIHQYTGWGRIWEFVIFNAALLLIFLVHNNVRKPYRITTIFYLRIYKVLYPVFFFLGIDATTTMAALIYSLALTFFNVLTYISAKYDDLGLSKANIFRDYYHNGRMRTIFFILNVPLLGMFAALFFDLDERAIILFILLVTSMFLAAYFILPKEYRFEPTF